MTDSSSADSSNRVADLWSSVEPRLTQESSRQLGSSVKRLCYVLRVDNVATFFTVDRLANFISTKLSVNKVLTCFEVKPRCRPGEDEENVKDKEAFHVCIFADDLDCFLDAEKWPDSVSVSTWFSKPAVSASVNDGRMPTSYSQRESIQPLSTERNGYRGTEGYRRASHRILTYVTQLRLLRYL